MTAIDPDTPFGLPVGVLQILSALLVLAVTVGTIGLVVAFRTSEAAFRRAGYHRPMWTRAAAIAYLWLLGWVFGLVFLLRVHPRIRRASTHPTNALLEVGTTWSSAAPSEAVELVARHLGSLGAVEVRRGRHHVDGFVERRRPQRRWVRWLLFPAGVVPRVLHDTWRSRVDHL